MNHISHSSFKLVCSGFCPSSGKLTNLEPGSFNLVNFTYPRALASIRFCVFLAQREVGWSSQGSTQGEGRAGVSPQ
jgi:hypothetical protein